nr:MAG TPA: hypothetical protein [Caudoviricetes sp.]
MEYRQNKRYVLRKVCYDRKRIRRMQNEKRSVFYER